MVLGKYIQYAGEQLDLQDIVQSYLVFFLCVDLKEKEEKVLFLKDLFFFI